MKVQEVFPDAYYLPVVELETGPTYFKSGAGEGWQAFQASQKTKMDAENLHMATNLHFLNVLENKHPRDRQLAEVTRVMTYGLLSQQAQIDAEKAGKVAAEARLPVVQSETIDSFGAGLDEPAWQALCDASFDRLLSRNEQLTNIIGGFLRASGVLHPDDKSVARQAMVFTHTFLDLQAIADVTGAPWQTGVKQQSDG